MVIFYFPHSFYINWNFSTRRNRPFFHSCFVCLIIYLYQYGFMNIYSILWVIAQYYINLFSSFSHWKLFQVGSSALSVCPLSFFEHFLIFWHYEMFQVYLAFFLPDSGTFYWRNQDLSAKCIHCYWSIVASRPSQWIELGKKYIYICFIYISYLYIYLCTNTCIHTRIFFYHSNHKYTFKNHEYIPIPLISVQHQKAHQSSPFLICNFFDSEKPSSLSPLYFLIFQP